MLFADFDRTHQALSPRFYQQKLCSIPLSICEGSFHKCDSKGYPRMVCLYWNIWSPLNLPDCFPFPCQVYQEINGQVPSKRKPICWICLGMLACMFHCLGFLLDSTYLISGANTRIGGALLLRYINSWFAFQLHSVRNHQFWHFVCVRIWLDFFNYSLSPPLPLGQSPGKTTRFHHFSPPPDLSVASQFATMHLEVLLTIVGALALGRALEQSCLAKCNLPTVFGQNPKGFVEFSDLIWWHGCFYVVFCTKESLAFCSD